MSMLFLPEPVQKQCVCTHKYILTESSSFGGLQAPSPGMVAHTPSGGSATY